MGWPTAHTRFSKSFAHARFFSTQPEMKEKTAEEIYVD